MAEERNDSREMTWRSLLPWTELFRGFQIALDPNKLFLAAIGIFLMALAWWFLAFVFSLRYNPNPPDFKQDYLNQAANAGADDKKKAELLKQGTATPASAQEGSVNTKRAEKALRNDDILTLAKVGLDDNLVISKINASEASDFDLSTEGIVALKSGKVSNAVIEAMMKQANKTK